MAAVRGFQCAEHLLPVFVMSQSLGIKTQYGICFVIPLCGCTLKYGQELPVRLYIL